MHTLKPVSQLTFGPGPRADKRTRTAIRKTVEAAAVWEDIARKNFEYVHCVPEAHTQAQIEAANADYERAKDALGIAVEAYDRAHGIE